MKIITAWGMSWMLDGLQVTLAGSLAGVLQDKKTLGLSGARVAVAATAYLSMFKDNLQRSLLGLALMVG
jgi:hypothetical protein